MSFRAILIGFVFAIILATTGYFNDQYMLQTSSVGNFFPVPVVGLLLVLVLVVSPLLFLMRRKWRFRNGELAVILALVFAVCVVPGAGFVRSFAPILVLSPHYEKTNASWQENQVLSYVPDGLLVYEQEGSDEVVGPFLRGKGSHNVHIGLNEVPWRAWLPALSRWLPLFLVLMFGLIGLSLVMHRQWSAHEHLVYPVAEFVRLLTDKGEGKARAFPAVIRNRLFWYGLVPILVIHIANGLHAWFPNFIQIPHEIDVRALKRLFPTLATAQGQRGFFQSQIIFSFVAFAYFLPSDITLSLGVANFFGVLFSAAMMTYGISATFTWMGAGELQGMLFGAYLAFTLLILYTGRAYYLHTLQHALRLKSGTAIEPSAVWGLRMFLAMSVLSVVIMHGMGLSVSLAVCMVLLFVMMFMPMSRICAETGLYFVQSSWQPVGILLGLFGAGALGPQMLTVATLMCLIISIDPREAMMPFITNALRIAENAQIKRGRVAVLMGAMLAVGLLVGTGAVLWQQYDRGVGRPTGWATKSVPPMGFNLVDSQIQTLKATGEWKQAVSASGLERLRLIKPNKRFVGFALVGFGLFGLCAFLRIRFTKWPFHPVLFLVWFTMPVSRYGTSWFIGWLIKVLVVKLGGGKTFQRLKPFMVGVIAGDLLGGFIFMVVGGIYYFITGFTPAQFRTFV